VTLAIAAPSEPSLEEYWPDIAELAHQATVTDEAMPAGMFFDLATIHVLTTATIDRLRELYPQGQFEVRRFRPNIAVRPDNDDAEFVESSWVERELRIGDDVELEITDHCPRCVMTTLPQGDLPTAGSCAQRHATTKYTSACMERCVAPGESSEATP